MTADEPVEAPRPCDQPCDPCLPEGLRGCIRPAGHHGFHSCQAESAFSEPFNDVLPDPRARVLRWTKP